MSQGQYWLKLLVVRENFYRVDCNCDGFSSQAAAVISGAASSQSKLLSQVPIQLVLSLARMVYAVQQNILPMFSDTNDLGQLPTYLKPLLTNASVLTAWQQAAQVSVYNTLTAMGVAGSEVPAGVVQASAYGAGALQQCTVSFLGLLSMSSAYASTSTVNGSLAMTNVQAGLVRLSMLRNLFASDVNLPPMARL